MSPCSFVGFVIVFLVGAIGHSIRPKKELQNSPRYGLGHISKKKHHRHEFVDGLSKSKL